MRNNFNAQNRLVRYGLLISTGALAVAALSSCASGVSSESASGDPGKSRLLGCEISKAAIDNVLLTRSDVDEIVSGKKAVSEVVGDLKASRTAEDVAVWAIIGSNVDVDSERYNADHRATRIIKHDIGAVDYEFRIDDMPHPKNAINIVTMPGAADPCR